MTSAFGLPEGKLVTHINGNRDDNRGAMLKEIATKYHIHPDTARMVVCDYRWQ